MTFVLQSLFVLQSSSMAIDLSCMAQAPDCHMLNLPMKHINLCAVHLQLEPGDVLVKLNGQIVTEFQTMEDMLDSAGEPSGN